MIIARVLAAAATAAGLAAWIVFLRADLVLSHYDAKAHLVVSRRILDNITPGWQQIGAVWLPLPHLIHAGPTQIDFLYRTGAFASMVSIACFGATVYAAARLVMRATGSPLGAFVAAALLTLNPNLLYLQATPMTEPLLLASMFLAVLWLYEWVPLNRDTVPARLGWVLFGAALTRYEAWLVIGAALSAALFASARVGASRDALRRRAWRLGAWPAAAVTLVLVNSRVTTGEWFVSSGFYVPDPAYQAHALRSLLAVWWGTHQLSTRTTEITAIAAAALFVGRALARRADAALIVPVALFASGVLPFYAFYEGHPFRIRYMIPAAAACAVFNGLAVGVLRRYPAIILAGLLTGITLLESPPWRPDAPMLLEAQWDRPASEGRRRVTECLAGYRGEKILASMASLAHYMQELSREDVAIADFIHEGNGAIWELAMGTGPAPHAGWMIVEERAEGGDVLAQRLRRDDAAFARGMTRICEGGGVALYKRE